MPDRRFPPPWSIEEQSACFVVRDHNGQALPYVYFKDEPGRLIAINRERTRSGRRDRIAIPFPAGSGRPIPGKPPL
jgi:hypothetical protein